jgi:hypothetical protein
MKFMSVLLDLALVKDNQREEERISAENAGKVDDKQFVLINCLLISTQGYPYAKL